MQFRSPTTDIGMLGEHHKFLVQVVDKHVGLCLAIISDVIPNFDKVDLGARPYENCRQHYYVFGSTPVLPASFLRAICFTSWGDHGSGSPLASPSSMSLRR